MAIDLLNTYGAGRVVVDGANPRGTFKDSTFVGALDGTPAQFAWARDMWAFLDRLLNEAGIIASGTPDTPLVNQRYDALVQVARDLWPIWDNSHTYSKGVLALGSDDKLYQSLQASNTNHDPISSPTWWIDFSAILPATTSQAGIDYLSDQVTISNNATTPATQIDFSGGKFDFDDGSGSAIVPPYTKDVSLPWAPGTAGGLDTGTPAPNTWYKTYRIYNPTTQASDYLISLAAGAPVLPAGFTKKSYSGSIHAGAAALDPFLQSGNYFVWDNFVTDVNITAGTTAAQIFTLTVPLNVRIKAKFAVSAGEPDVWYVNFTCPDQPDTVPIVSNCNFLMDNTGINNTLNIRTNSLSQIRARWSKNTTMIYFYIITQGWEDLELDK